MMTGSVSANARSVQAPLSRPPFKFVTSICPRILSASESGGFPWSNGFDYDSDSVQHAVDFTLHTPGFGFQKFLQPFEFGN